MSDSGFASLGPSLLARKGGAKPAMRPQVAPLVTDETPVAEEQLEDLGWNDMGEDAEPGHGGAGIVVPIDPATPFDAEAVAASPIVRRQQRRLEERVLADAVMTGPEDCDTEIDDDEATAFDAVADAYADAEDTAFTVSAPAPSPIVAKVPATQAIPAKRSASAGRRAAFTLRLDPQRHLKLRLAATMQGVSAQALVTDALDRLLAEIDELDAIAARVQRH